MQQSESALLLQECRQIMTKRMRASITAMLNEIDETLLTMAQANEGEMNESACYEAIREIRLKRVEIKTRFERRFINLFENEIELFKHPEKGDISGQWEIIRTRTAGDSERTETLPLEKSLGVVRKDCGQILLELDRKMGLLLDTPKSVNPMQPEIVFEAFQDACWDIKSGEEVRLMMFRIFERRIAEELQSIYEDINRVLDGQGELLDVIGNSNSMLGVMPKPEEETVLLRYEVTGRIENRLSGHEVPDFIRSFLLNHWRIFLEDIYSCYSENSIAWNAARQTMDDLIWIVKKPGSLYDRQRQVQLLPSLLFRLLNGMKVIALEDAEIEKFLKKLKEHQLSNLDTNIGPILDSITEEAKSNVSRSLGKNVH